MFEGDGILGGIGSIRAEGINFLLVQILRFSERLNIYHLKRLRLYNGAKKIYI